MAAASSDLPPRDPWGVKTGKDYTPFINVYESHSIGELFRIRCQLTGRNHHYLSKGEAGCHFAARLTDGVVDIREQYPIIPVSRTLELAKQLHVSHPQKGREPFEVTIDLMLTIATKDGYKYLARSFKRTKDLRTKNVLNRQALEYASCSDRSVPWKLATEQEITDDMFSRARWLFLLYKNHPKYSVDPDLANRFVDAMSTQYFDEPLRDVLTAIAIKCQLTRQEALNLFRHMVCTRRLKVDLNRPLTLKDPHLALADNFR